jgi:hypothetical protein
MMAIRVSSVLKSLGFGVIALSALGALAWFAAGGAVGIAESRLSEFPDWPGRRLRMPALRPS